MISLHLKKSLDFKKKKGEREKLASDKAKIEEEAKKKTLKRKM